MLGQKLIKLFKVKTDDEVYGLSRGENRLLDQKGYHYYSIDLGNKEELHRQLTAIRAGCYYSYGGHDQC